MYFSSVLYLQLVLALLYSHQYGDLNDALKIMRHRTISQKCNFLFNRTVAREMSNAVSLYQSVMIKSLAIMSIGGVSLT